MLKHKSLQSFLTTTVVLLGPLYISSMASRKKRIEQSRVSIRDFLHGSEPLVLFIPICFKKYR